MYDAVSGLAARQDGGVQIGIHLPQFGRVSSAEAITRAARHAEDLGFAGVWVSDHIVQPADQDYPSPWLFDPLVTLTWAAACTEQVGIGISVWVVPHHNSLESANALASLDRLSGGRLTVGVGVGWSRGEFAALGRPFADRGRRTDEALALWRTVWRDDPATFDGRWTSFRDLRVLPKPAHEIALWVGGSGPRAESRAVEAGDGFHLIGVTPEQARGPIDRVRAARPEPGFVVSLRTGWDPRGMEPDQIRAEHEAYAEAGVDYVVAAPWRSTLDEWLGAMEDLATLVRLTPR